MSIIANDHFDKLKAYGATDAAIKELYDFGKPAYDNFIKLYDKTQLDQDDYGYYTDQFEALIAELVGTRVRQWDAKVMIEYDIDTPEYKRIMKGGRMSFREGGYDSRLSRVRKLASVLNEYSTLSTLAAEVKEFSAKLQETRTMQQGKEGGGQVNSDLLEEARVELGLILYAIKGRLMGIFYRTPERIENFYELKLLRAGGSRKLDDAEAPRESFEVTVEASTSVSELVGKLSNGDTVRVTNTGGVAFTAIFGTQGSTDTTGVLVEAGQFTDFTVGTGNEALRLEGEAGSTGAALIEVFEFKS